MTGINSADQYSLLLFYLDFAGRNIARHRVTTTQKGWQATLDLRFQQAGGKTVLASAQHVGPLTVQRPFYPEEETCHLYLLHPPGGIVGGDELTARTLPRLPYADNHAGASKFYRSSGAQALVRQQLTLPRRRPEWLPQDAIFFPGRMPGCSPPFIFAPPAGCWSGICSALAAR